MKCPVCGHPKPVPTGYDPYSSIPRWLDLQDRPSRRCSECDRRIYSDDHIWISGDVKICCHCYANLSKEQQS